MTSHAAVTLISACLDSHRLTTPLWSCVPISDRSRSPFSAGDVVLDDRASAARNCSCLFFVPRCHCPALCSCSRLLCPCSSLLLVPPPAHCLDARRSRIRAGIRAQGTV